MTFARIEKEQTKSLFITNLQEISNIVNSNEQLLTRDLHALNKWGFEWIVLTIAHPFFRCFGVDVFSHIRINKVIKNLIKYLKNNTEYINKHSENKTIKTIITCLGIKTHEKYHISCEKALIQFGIILKNSEKENKLKKEIFELKKILIKLPDSKIQKTATLGIKIAKLNQELTKIKINELKSKIITKPTNKEDELEKLKIIEKSLSTKIKIERLINQKNKWAINQQTWETLKIKSISKDLKAQARDIKLKLIELLKELEELKLELETK